MVVQNLCDFSQKYSDVFTIKRILQASMKIEMQVQHQLPILLQFIATLVTLATALVSEFDSDHLMPKHLESVLYGLSLAIMMKSKVHSLRYSFDKIAAIVETFEDSLPESMTIDLKFVTNIQSPFFFSDLIVIVQLLLHFPLIEPKLSDQSDFLRLIIISTIEFGRIFSNDQHTYIVLKEMCVFFFKRHKTSIKLGKFKLGTFYLKLL